MKSFLKYSLFLAVICTSIVRAQELRDLNWLELLPESDKIALLNQPAVEHGTDPSQETRPLLGGNLGPNAASDPQDAQTLQSSNIVSELDKQNVRLPGFVVPLEFDEAQNVTEFFLVPYFGACIHTPPPPPNQIIYVQVPDGFKLKSIYEPYYVEGMMSIAMTHKEIGTSAYSMTAQNVVIYSN